MIAAIFAAFPHELKHIFKNCLYAQDPEEPLFPLQGKPHPPYAVIAVQTGMGAANAETAFRRILQKRRPDIVLSVGFSGALYDDAGIGDIVWSSSSLLCSTQQREHCPEHAIADSVLGRQIGEKLSERTAAREGSIITLTGMMTKSNIKKMIPAGLPFPVCDMETFYLANLSYHNRVPFLAVRAITDRLNEEIPQELFTVTDSSGRYRFSRAFTLLLAKPKRIPASIRLGRKAALASKNLGKAVDSLTEILATLTPHVYGS